MKLLTRQTPVADLFMVGPTYAKRLAKLDIFTAEDLLHHYPFRWEDYRLLTKISQLQGGEVVTIKAQILTFKNIFTKFGKRIQKLVVFDETGQIPVLFFNQTFLSKVLKVGFEISLSGKVDTFAGRLALVSPEYEIIKNDKGSKKETIHTGRLVPVYPETYGVSSKWLRSRIFPLLDKLLFSLPDWLPQQVKKYNNLIDLSQALGSIHKPQDKKGIETAKERLAFDELFLIQLQTLLRRRDWKKTKTTRPLKVNKEKLQQFIDKLPFTLTQDQQAVARQILIDIGKSQPMNRILQGDVGCGKTVVAAIASYVAYLNKTQVALMAPTEILAFQHYQTFKNLLEPYGVRIGLVTGSRKVNCSIDQLNNCPIDVIIGTHALLYQKIDFTNLGLVVIDEQHRFGVEQRAELIKKCKAPHTLVMTATPIPRTVALTLYGDLDLSAINQMPLGRRPTKTWVVPPEKRLSAYAWVKKQIQTTNSQTFVVCPLIELSDKESMKDIKAAKDEFNKLKTQIFPDLKLGLLHGRMKAVEKEKVINDFRAQKLNILVATPVVEVGIDIPQATIILIEAADRFGLATLHQLRGRVGRSDKQSYCLLFASEAGKGYRRLKLLEKSTNGMYLAEMDLKLRGPGELYGTSQHGFLKLKIASFSEIKLIEKSRLAANWIIKKSQANLTNFPLLREKLKNYTIKPIEPN